MSVHSSAGRWVRSTEEPGQISTESAASLRKELSDIASRSEEQNLQFVTSLNKEQEARVKDVSELHALRERDLAEMEALKQTLHSLLSNQDNPPRAACSFEIDSQTSTTSGLENMNMETLSGTGNEADELVRPIAWSLLTATADDMKKLDGTGIGADEVVHAIARLSETVSTEQGSLRAVGAGDTTNLDSAENQADNLESSVARSPEDLSADRNHPTTIAADDVKKLDDAGTDVDSMVCSAPSSKEIPNIQQCRFTTTAGGDVKTLDAARDELENAAVVNPAWLYAARDEVANNSDEHPSALEYARRPLSSSALETELKCSAAMELARNGPSPTNGVTFMVYCDSVKIGNHVRLVGSSEDLGMWQLEKGLLLTTSETEFPWWRLGNPVCISPDQLVEYKYVLCENTTGNSCEWESCGNRTLKLGGQPVVKDFFGSHDECDLAHLAQELPVRLSRHQYSSNDMRREHSCTVSPLTLKMQEPGFAEDFKSCYEVLGSGPLREGTFTQVWRCCSKCASAGAEVPKHVAKIVHTGQLTDSDRYHMLGENGEIALHSRLSHPHIVHLCKHFEESRSLTLVLEYCCGGDLFDAIVKSDGLSETASARMLRHLLMALCYVHGCLITHRDVKCENILLQHTQTDPEKNIFKLCDFGLSARIQEEGLTDRVGTPDTVAPELIRGEAYGKLVDVWSAGAVTYMALVAASPFAAATPALTVELVKAAKFSTAGPAWREISEMAKDTVKELMDPDIRTRPDAQRALDNMWFEKSAKD